MTQNTDQAPVLITGGSGFVAGHCILAFLAAGRTVRTSVRDLAREASVREILAGAGATTEHLERLSFVAADLLDDAGWAEAVADVDAVVHVASPVNPGHVENEDDVIVPAREGALRVIRAAHAAGIRRVVLTSAFHAIGFGHGQIDHVFTEDDWSPLDGPGMDAYGRSKVLAERAAWEFVEANAASPELVTLQPVAILGPVMGGAVSGTNHILQNMLNGGMPGFPDVAIPFVDVRDVAAAHLAALDAPDAAGKRILIAAQASATPLREVGALLRETFGAAAAKVPTQDIPSEVIRANAETRPEFRGILGDLGYVKRLSIEREKNLLGLSPRPWQTAVVDGARSMLERGLAG